MQFPLALACLLPGALAGVLAPRQSASPSSSSSSSSYACNNSPDLCSRSYSNITQLGAHDSPFVSNGSSTSIITASAGNQDINSTAQLSAGVRLLSAQVHLSNGEWHLCHTSCFLLDAGTLSSWLSSIKTWLDQNPHDVVTLLLVNSDSASAEDLSAEYQTANLTHYTYAPPSSTSSSSSSPLPAWPTLQEMISNNTRLVTFVTPLTQSSSAPYLLSEFTYLFENPYNVTSPTSFSCAPDRPPSLANQTTAAISSGRLPLVNHFLDTEVGLGIETPDPGAIGTTNAANGTGSLGEAASSCTSEYGRKPTFFLVDFATQGGAIGVVDGLNGVTQPTGRSGTQGQTLPGQAKGAAARVGGGGDGVLRGLYMVVVAVVCVGWLSG